MDLLLHGVVGEHVVVDPYYVPRLLSLGTEPMDTLYHRIHEIAHTHTLAAGATATAVAAAMCGAVQVCASAATPVALSTRALRAIVQCHGVLEHCSTQRYTH